MEFTERPDLRATHYLNSIPYDTFRAECLDDADRNDAERPKEKDVETWFATIKSFCDSVIKTKGHITRVYRHSRNTPAGLGGRLYSGGSAQGIWSPYRGLCFRDIATDIDMVNAHPVILQYICEKHDIPCPQLEYYIKYRTKCLSEFKTSAHGKKMYLIATNSDVKSSMRDKPQHFAEYEREMHRIQKELAGKHEYRKIVDTVPADKLEKNYNGSAMNRVLCYYENIILGHAIHFLNQRGLEIAILMFDGLMVYGNHYEDTQLLTDMQNYVNEQMSGLQMKWKYKEHDTSVQVPTKFDETNYTPASLFRSVMSDKEASDLFFEELKGRLLSDPQGRIFMKVGNVWVCDTQSVQDYVIKHITSSGVMRKDKNGKVSEYTSGLRNSETIAKLLLTYIRRDNVHDIYEKFHTTTKGKLCFQDGVLDLRARTFTKWDDLTEEIYTTLCINYPFGQWFATPNPDTIQEVKTHVFDNMFGHHTDRALRFLSRAIAGHCEDKRWSTFIGKRDCGKGVLYSALSNAFKDYVGTFEIANLMYQRYTETAEVSRKMYWLMDLEFMRLAISQEIPAAAQGMKLDIKKMKKISGGEDKQVARRNHDRHDTVFSLDTTFMVMGNEELLADGKDAFNTCLQFASAYQFKTQSEIDGYVASGAPSELISSFKVADPTIKSKCTTDEWKCAVVYLLYQNYTNAVVEIPTDEVVEDAEEPLMLRVLKTYQITGNPSDIITVPEVYDALGGNKKQITAELERMGVVKKQKSNFGGKLFFVGLRPHPPPEYTDCPEDCLGEAC